MVDTTMLTEKERTELLDHVSACQSSYHIDSTPGHRFGGLPSNLQENREALVAFVEELLEARGAASAQSVAVPEIDYDELIKAAAVSNKNWTPGKTGCIAFARGAAWFKLKLASVLSQPKG